MDLNKINNRIVRTHLIDAIQYIEWEWNNKGHGVYDNYDGEESDEEYAIKDTELLLESLKLILNVLILEK